jgi:hypothetical protein
VPTTFFLCRFLHSLIEYQFGQFGAKNESIYGSFNTQRLNQSGAAINSTIDNNTPLALGYLFATLAAYNATDPGVNDTGFGNNTNVTSTGSSGGSPNTGLAMSVLKTLGASLLTNLPCTGSSYTQLQGAFLRFSVSSSSLAYVVMQSSV